MAARASAVCRLPSAVCRPAQASRRTTAMAAWSAAPSSGPMPHPPAPPAPFRRRVFWLLPHDRDEEPDRLYAGSVPAGAVDPETLQPTLKGRRTERGEGGEGGSSVPGDAGTRPGSPAPPIDLSVRSGGASDRDERFSVPGPACAPHPPRRHTHAPSPHAW
ncbi:DUF6009 family protein [Streptomyces sp. NPDC090298]|uniref:DUF6009 family protein n=1 Tax=Streptomyces sp. NPDC090298 TaxID=3365959 RepID=UPI0037F7954B